MPRSGFEMACTAIPAACSCSATSFQPELSANAPWTRATVTRELAAVLASVMRFLLGGDDGRLGCALPAGVRPGPERAVQHGSEQAGPSSRTRPAARLGGRTGQGRSSVVRLSGERGQWLAGFDDVGGQHV